MAGFGIQMWQTPPPPPIQLEDGLIIWPHCLSVFWPLTKAAYFWKPLWKNSDQDTAEVFRGFPFLEDKDKILMQKVWCQEISTWDAKIWEAQR